MKMDMVMQDGVRHGRKTCGAHSIKEKDLKELFVSAYNEAINYKSNSGDLGVLKNAGACRARA